MPQLPQLPPPPQPNLLSARASGAARGEPGRELAAPPSAGVRPCVRAGVRACARACAPLPGLFWFNQLCGLLPRGGEDDWVGFGSRQK